MNTKAPDNGFHHAEQEVLPAEIHQVTAVAAEEQ